jgi:hypothetical protein
MTAATFGDRVLIISDGDEKRDDDDESDETIY